MRGEATCSILLVISDEPTLDAVHQLLRAYRPCLLCRSIADARQLLDSRPPFCGAVVEIGSGDAGKNALAMLQEIRGQYPTVPACVLMASASEDFVNQAIDLRARPLFKGSASDRLRAFGLACALADVEPVFSIRDALCEVATLYGLTELEVETLHAAVYERRASWFTAHRGICPATYKSRVATLLRKTKADDLSMLVREVFWTAIRESRAKL